MRSQNIEYDSAYVGDTLDDFEQFIVILFKRNKSIFF